MSKAGFKLPNFNALVNTYDMTASEFDEAAKELVQAAQDIQFDAMQEGLARHKRTGAAMEALQKNPIERDGNRTFTNTGITLEGSRSTSMVGFWAAWFQEYGAARHDSGKVLFEKDPWMRPAIDGTKPKIQAAWKGIMKRRGYPTK